MQKRIIEALKVSLIEWIEFIVSGWPESYVGKKLRRFYWRKKYKLVSFPTIGRHSKLYGDNENIFIGDNFGCGEYVEINACTSHGIYIGNNVLIARGVFIRAANHQIDRLDIPINQQGHTAACITYKDRNYSVVIEDDVWIAANAIILSGARIAVGSVVGAGAIVPNKEYPPYSIIVGNPAKILRSRKKFEQTELLPGNMYELTPTSGA